jgi:hypothetical protein
MSKKVEIHKKRSYKPRQLFAAVAVAATISAAAVANASSKPHKLGMYKPPASGKAPFKPGMYKPIRHRHVSPFKPGMYKPIKKR